MNRGVCHHVIPSMLRSVWHRQWCYERVGSSSDSKYFSRVHPLSAGVSWPVCTSGQASWRAAAITARLVLVPLHGGPIYHHPAAITVLLLTPRITLHWTLNKKKILFRIAYCSSPFVHTITVDLELISIAKLFVIMTRTHQFQFRAWYKRYSPARPPAPQLKLQCATAPS